MANPPNMRVWTRGCDDGRQVHVYSNAERIVLQVRYAAPTADNLLAPSCKVATKLFAQDALALAGELLAAAARVLEGAAFPPHQGDEPEPQSARADATASMVMGVEP